MFGQCFEWRSTFQSSSIKAFWPPSSHIVRCPFIDPRRLICFSLQHVGQQWYPMLTDKFLTLGISFHFVYKRPIREMRSAQTFSTIFSSKFHKQWILSFTRSSYFTKGNAIMCDVYPRWRQRGWTRRTMAITWLYTSLIIERSCCFFT